MTSILRSDATSAMGFTLGFVIGFPVFGSPLHQRGEGPSPAEEMLQADTDQDPATDSAAGPTGEARKPWLITPTLSADPKTRR